MKILFCILISTFCICFNRLQSAPQVSPTKLEVLYNSLDPTSISQHLAFYELYGETTKGKQAFHDAWNLIHGRAQHLNPMSSQLPIDHQLIWALVSLVNKEEQTEPLILDDKSLDLFTSLSKRLSHYSLKGHHVWDEKDVLALPLEDIDVSRGLFISQFGNDKRKILTYEGIIDLMAFQVLARLSPHASPQEKIATINTLIFDEMGFRFPPHSLYTKEIDTYTFLTSVLDLKRGVCLGVSILYIALAQRLNLKLEMVTPPGHIYVRHKDSQRIINIETTARGIHLNCDEYLSLNTRSLQLRTAREVIGMAHFNQASIFWQKKNFPQVIQSYEKAWPYLSSDPVLKELLGYAYILNGDKDKGEKLLKEVQGILPDYAVNSGTTIDDYFNGFVDKEGLEALFIYPEEDRQSLLAKKAEIETLIEKNPKFCAGHLSLASLWLKLHRATEAINTLKTYIHLNPNDAEVHYYLASLYLQRYYYPLSSYHLKKAAILTAARNHFPQELKELKRELVTRYPDIY